MQLRKRSLSILGVSLWISLGSFSFANEFHLKASWNAQGTHRELKSWSLADLSHLHKWSSREKDPVSGKVIKWEGVLMSQIVDQLLKHLPVENQAQIDLIILKNQLGERALIPRSLISSYPLFLAYQWESSSPKDHRGPLYSVVPWSSKPKILKEVLPLEKYFLGQVSQVELTNYRDQYSFLYLKRETDPSAMRGQKFVVQNCVGCHTASPGANLFGLSNSEQISRFASLGHPSKSAIGPLSERDRRSVVRYLEAHQSENPGSMTKLIQSMRATTN